MDISNEQGMLLLLHQANGNLETVKQLMIDSYQSGEKVPHGEIAKFLMQIEISITEIVNIDEAEHTRKGVQPQQLQGNMPRQEKGEKGLYFEENPN